MMLFVISFILFLLIIIYNLFIERELNKLKLIYSPILFAQSVELDSLYRRSNFLISMYNENEIKKYAEKLKWNISKYKIINEEDENSTAPIAAKLAGEGKVKIIVKGHIHTDILIKAVLKRDLNLIGKKRLSHVWHMTLNKDDKPFIITDGVVNVLPKLEVKMHILRNAVDFANKIGISRPKVSVLSATEEVIESVPSSIEANLITKRAKEENINADVFGPLAFDNSVSKKSATIKKIKKMAVQFT